MKRSRASTGVRPPLDASRLTSMRAHRVPMPCPSRPELIGFDAKASRCRANAVRTAVHNPGARCQAMDRLALTCCIVHLHESQFLLAMTSAGSFNARYSPSTVADIQNTTMKTVHGTTAVAKPASACFRSVSCPKLRCSSNIRPHASTKAAIRGLDGGVASMPKRHCSPAALSEART